MELRNCSSHRRSLSIGCRDWMSNNHLRRGQGFRWKLSWKEQNLRVLERTWKASSLALRVVLRGSMFLLDWMSELDRLETCWCCRRECLRWWWSGGWRQCSQEKLLDRENWCSQEKRCLLEIVSGEGGGFEKKVLVGHGSLRISLPWYLERMSSNGLSTCQGMLSECHIEF